jgi:hypothetical protein
VVGLQQQDRRRDLAAKRRMEYPASEKISL